MVFVAFGEILDTKPKGASEFVEMNWECNGKAVKKFIEKATETNEGVKLDGGSEMDHVILCPFWRCLKKPTNAPPEACSCLDERMGVFEAPIGYFKTSDKLRKMASAA